ncbi:endoplasmic reticulum metallopeptidase 1-like [Drosophila nasuta]|uniref:endoplasmic reticulum metallopeptidase 1-like n=1 Tax=Drosophila nasuta TaxID=42062 RepID=UPI00295E5C3D|nr:endoplasmic reticulum metallopeptidase 1-like [Drosophila nasuta]
MSDKDRLISREEGEERLPKYRTTKDITDKPSWYFGNGFVLFWMLLFFAVVIPLMNRLPTALNIEETSSGEFIGERAYNTLNNLVNIGSKVVGSTTNEVSTVDFLLTEIEDIKQDMLSDYYDLEVDVQQTSGSFRYSHLLNMYQGVQNVIVKLSSKNSSSESYLLVNSHFDTVLTSPGAGDDGFMVAVMLEVLRVMATTNKQHFEHPVVFLFNGAEEAALQASHGFITQHKWAPNCKALINLDAAGSGGREFLFQSGPYHPWLVNYYKKSAKHPGATTLGEEVFQAGLIPSDTDFAAFVEFGKIPGLDIAQGMNGFVYHTKYDRVDVIPRGSIQNTGDNILGLVRALANAPEMYNTEAYATGHAVFFDFLGLFFISYSAETGTIVNYCAAGVTLLLIFISVWRMSTLSELSSCSVFQRLIFLVIIQIVGLVLALALPLQVAYYFDSIGKSLTYFSSSWLLIGLYICPSLIGLSLPITIYYLLQQNIKLPFNYHLQLGLHSWAIVLSVLDIVLTMWGIRSAYIFTIPIVFYAGAMIANMVTTFHDRGYSWAGLVMAGQAMPFLYSSSLFYLVISVMIPMNGRSGSSSNPDLFIAALGGVGTILSLGFLIPLINMFRKPITVILTLLLASAVTIYLASSTEIGFPYRVRTNSFRATYQHVRKIYYEYGGRVSFDESGYLFSFQDRREAEPMNGVRLTGARFLREDCEKHMMCGMPLFDERWVANRLEGIWVHRADHVVPPVTTNLTLLSKTVLENNTTVRYEFELEGPDHMSLFIQPEVDDFVTLSNWSFPLSYLQNPPEYPLPYHIYYTYGIITTPLKFFLEFSKANGNFEVPIFQLGVSGHCIGGSGDALSQKFANSFPSYTSVVEWPSTYLRYIY